MAGDWIKMRVDLQTHPKVVRILSATKADKFRAIGGLHAVWSVFDTHSVDGNLYGYTPETLDHIIGWQGFSAALLTVGWLAFDGKETLSLPEFTEHNGQSGKRRAEDQKRKRDGRRSPVPVRQESGQIADTMRTREEKRREEKEDGATASPVGSPPLSLESPSPKKPCPHQQIVALYHEVLPELRRVQTWNETRQRLLGRRWSESSDRQDVEWWRQYFGYVRQSPFLMGKTTGRDGRPFDCDLEWLVSPKNFAKVIEGKYEDAAA
jgi:hypothetical protein